MTTITATPDITNASVLLSITETASVSHVERTDINGTREVRVPAYTLPSYGTGILHITDYEASHGAVTYRVYHTGSVQVPSVTTDVELTQPWLFVPVLPHLSVTVKQVSSFQSSRTSSTILHKVLDRADPAVKMGVLGLREGQLDIWCPDYATTRTLDAVIASGETLLLKQADIPGMDMYFVVSDTDSQPYSEEGAATQWRYTVRFHETARPEGLLKSARGWTYDELVTIYNTYDEVGIFYTSYDNLLISDEF